VERTRIGLVGAGAVGRRHATVLAGFPDVELAGVADVDTAAAASLAATLGTSPHASAEALVESVPLDALYICVPPFAHGPPERAALAAGLPFFVEKPLAADWDTAVALADEVADSGLVTAAGYHWRYLDTVERAGDLLADSPPRLVIGYWLDKVPPPAWWLDRRRSGGQTIEQATHVLDLIRVLVGEVEQVYAAGSASVRAAFPGATIDDVSAATLRFRSGAVGSLVATCLLTAKHRAGLELFADGLTLSLSELDMAFDRGDGARVTPAAGDAKRQVDRDFVDAVRGGPNRVRVDYSEALATHRLACAVAVSAERAKAVELEPAVRRVGVGRRSGSTPPISASERPWALGLAAPYEPRFFEYDRSPVGEGEFGVETLFTGLSAGTELTYYKGTNPYLHAEFDQEYGVFRGGRAGVGYPIERLGYMEVGRVVESRSHVVAVGQLVAMAYGHRTEHVAHAARERFVVLPRDVNPLLGVYVAHMGPICANGLLHAGAELAGGRVGSLGAGVSGRHVVVIGAGVVGLLTGLFAAQHGAAAVAVVDPGASRLAAARELGLAAVPERPDVWERFKEAWVHGPRDRGADVVFQCRGRAESLALALRCVRPQGAVVDLAFYQDGAAAVRLGEEFHHNGLAIRCAQIARVPRGLGESWSRDRLSQETIELLRRCGGRMRDALVTDVLPLDEAPRLLAQLAAREREVLQAVFTVAP
jgi:predicted dehydrogenase